MKSMQFNKKFYNVAAIRDAADDFKNICELEVLDDPEILDDHKILDDHNIIVNITSKSEEYSEEKIKREFGNYVLGLMKNKNLV